MKNELKTPQRPIGRPRKDPEFTRVLVSVRVHPKTAAAIKRKAAASKVSMGELLDMHFQ